MTSLIDQHIPLLNKQLKNIGISSTTKEPKFNKRVIYISPIFNSGLPRKLTYKTVDDSIIIIMIFLSNKHQQQQQQLINKKINVNINLMPQINI